MRLRGAQLAVVVGFAIVVLVLYVNLASSERKVEPPQERFAGVMQKQL